MVSFIFISECVTAVNSSLFSKSETLYICKPLLEMTFYEVNQQKVMSDFQLTKDSWFGFRFEPKQVKLVDKYAELEISIKISLI